MDKFPVMKAGDIVSAAHLNALSEIAKRTQAEVPDRGYGAGTPLQIMYITEVILEPSDEADDDDDSSYSSSSSDSQSSVSHSTSSSSKSSSSGVRTVWNDVRSYLALPLYYDHGGKAWYKDTTHIPYELDASAFHGQFKVGDTCLAYWDAARNAYIAQPQVGGGGSSTSTTDSGGGSSSSNDCCCNELNCITVVGYTGTILPLYYSVTAFACGCEGDAADTLSKLYQVDLNDDTIWESEHVSCAAPSGATVTITITTVWTWNGASWDATSTTPSGGSCSPAQPTFSGSSIGQTTPTTCTGTTTSDGTTMATMFWRLTIDDAFEAPGCDNTVLEFHIE